MNEWIKVRNDAFHALSQAEERSRELKERFKNTKKKIYHLNVYLVRAEHLKERALVAYSTNPRSAHLQEELTTARERVARAQQELADLEALMDASKSEYRFLHKEIPLLQKGYDDAQQLFWFGVFEEMQERIRKAVGSEMEQAFAAYSATFARDLSHESFLHRLFPVPTDTVRMIEIRKELEKKYPLTLGAESESKTYSLAAPARSNQEGSLSPSEEARQWASLVRS
ncbi:MAG: hypothetical protein HQL93_07855 [Magnetococcales bacterium]|nr:hypothetical protein [Magnetococcales bacterium]